MMAVDSKAAASSRGKLPLLALVLLPRTHLDGLCLVFMFRCLGCLSLLANLLCHQISLHNLE